MLELSKKPTLPLLTFMSTEEEGLKIIERIGTNYRTLGIVLLNDKDGHKTDSIIIDSHPSSATVKTQGVIAKWLNSGGREPVTWATFIAVLKEISLSELAGDIEKLACSNDGQNSTDNGSYASLKTLTFLFIGLL